MDKSGEEDRLRALLTSRAATISDDVVKAEGKITAAQLRLLRRLARLAEIRDAARPQRRRRRWVIILLAAGTVLLVSALATLRMRTTEVELDLKVSEVTFTLPTAAVADPVGVTSLGVSNLRAIDLPPSRLRDGKPYDGPSILLSVAKVRGRNGTVDLDGLALPAKTVVTLRRSKGPHEYELLLSNSDTVLTASVDGAVRVGIGDVVKNETLEFTAPRQVRLVPGAAGVTLVLTLGDSATQTLSYQLPVQNLQLCRIDQCPQPDDPVVRTTSTIRSGTLSLASVGGAARQLRPSEAVQFTRSDGEIRELELGGNHIALRFNGRVRGLSTGSGNVQHTLMPTLLDWLMARRVPLLWTAIAYIFGVLGTVMRWWKLDA